MSRPVWMNGHHREALEKVVEDLDDKIKREIEPKRGPDVANPVNYYTATEARRDRLQDLIERYDSANAE